MTHCDHAPVINSCELRCRRCGHEIVCDPNRPRYILKSKSGLKGNKSLSNEDVKLIRKCKKEKARLMAQIEQFSDRALAKKFGVSHRTISRINQHETYKEIR